MLDITQPQSYHRAATALMHVQALQPALKFANAGLRWAPSNADLSAHVKRSTSMVADARW